MGHIIVYAIFLIIAYAVGRAHGRNAVMGQVRNAAQSFRDFLK